MKIKKSICYLFGAGEHYCKPPPISPADYVIAVDGGLAYLEQHHITPHLIIGDFDSVNRMPDNEKNVIVLPREKNETDMVAALEKGLELGHRCFHLYGGTGGRLDHTLANIQCLVALACRSSAGYLFDRETVITAIHNGCIRFPSAAQGIISVFSHSDSSVGVYETGMKYPLDNRVLQNQYPLGISNEFIGVPSSIAVQDGTLIVIYPKSIREVHRE